MISVRQLRYGVPGIRLLVLLRRTAHVGRTGCAACTLSLVSAQQGNRCSPPMLLYAR